MVTMHDVAVRAGVSAKTVSRVFNQDDHVSTRTRKAVEAAMQDLKYVPNMLARTFRAGRASVIGIAVPDIADPFFAAIIREIDQIAQRHAHAIAVTSLGFQETKERATVEALLRRQMDGLIIAPISMDQGYLATWLQHLPLVFIDREPQNIVADLFIEHDRDGARIGVSHLVSRGHCRIAFVGDSENVITTRRRLDGYRQALTEADLPVEEDLIVLSEPQRAARSIEGLLGRAQAPSAIFSSNSRTSIEIVPALQRLDRTEVALVSFGDFPMASALRPSVTVLDQDPARLGRAAAERIFARLASPNRRYRRRTIFDVVLVERESSAPSRR